MLTHSVSSGSVHTATASEPSVTRAGATEIVETAVPIAMFSQRHEPQPVKPVPPPKWSRSLFGAVLTVSFFFLLLGAALLVCALPPLFIERDTGRKVYVATMVPTTAVLGTVMCCYTFVMPYIRSNRFLVKSAAELTRHRDFLVASRALAKQLAVFSATEDGSQNARFGPAVGDDADAGSRYYHSSPAAQQHADSLDIKREMSWIRRQLEHLLADRTLRSGNPTMSVQQRSLQLFLFSFLDLQQEIMTLLQETIANLKDAHQAPSVRGLTVNTSRSAPRTPALHIPRNCSITPIFTPRDAPDSPALQPVQIDDDHSVPNSVGSQGDLSLLEPLSADIPVDGDDDLPPEAARTRSADKEGLLERAEPQGMPRSSTPASTVHLPTGGRPDAPPPVMGVTENEKREQIATKMSVAGIAAPTTAVLEQESSAHSSKSRHHTLDVIANSAVAHHTGPPPAATARTPDGVTQPVVLSIPQDHAPPPSTILAEPKPVLRTRPSQPTITIRRGSRFATDNGFVFLHVAARTRSTFALRESTLIFEACPSPATAALGDTHMFAPHTTTGLPLKGYALIGGRRNELSIAELRSLGFASCDVEKVSLDDTASPSTSTSLTSPRASAKAADSMNSSALLDGSAHGSPYRRSHACHCPAFTEEESFIVSWAPLPDVPMRLTFLTVDFEDTTSTAPTPARRMCVPVLECLIQDVLCVVTKFTADMRGSDVRSVTLEGTSLEDAISRQPSSVSSSRDASPNQADGSDSDRPTGLAGTGRFRVNAAPTAEDLPAFAVGAVVTQTIELS